MKAEKVNMVMPKIFTVLRTHPLTRHVSLRQVHILTRIIYLSLLHSENSKNRRTYCVPSERYLSRAADCTRETVSRNINKLKALDMLSVLHRRPHRGRFSTNLYKLGRVLWSLIQHLTTCFFSIPHRVTSASHIVTESRNNSISKTKAKDFPHRIALPDLQEILLRIEKVNPELI